MTVSSASSISSVTGTSPLYKGSKASYSQNGVVLGSGIGAWSSSNSGIATVDVFGLVSGIAAGTCNIVYTITGGCNGIVSAQQSVTIQTYVSATPVDGVGIYTTTPNASAELDIKSDPSLGTKQGVLIPAMTTAQMNAIASPPQGLLIYNTSYAKFMYNAGTPVSKVWQFVGEVSKNTSAQLSSTAGVYVGEMRLNTSSTPATMFYWDGTHWQEIAKTGNTTP
jgi:hypothetical protein